MKTYLFKIIAMFCAILIELSLISCGCGNSDAFEKKKFNNWQEQDTTNKPANTIPELMFTKILYEQDSNRVVYTVININSVEAQGVELRYTNISADAAGKAVLLNGKQSGTVSLGDIASGALSLNASLGIDFRSSQKAKFKFEILYQGQPIENATTEEEFEVLPPRLRLVSISSEKLFGLNPQFVFKIEKLFGIGLVDMSKLKVAIKRDAPNKGKIYYNGKEVIEEIVGADLGPIGDNIAFVIKYDIPESIMYEYFTIQLIYDGSEMDRISLSWKPYEYSAYKVLFEAVLKNDLNKVEELLKSSLFDMRLESLYEGIDTLFPQAVRTSNKDIIQKLLANGASVNVQEKRSSLTPLHIAIERGDPAIILLLLGTPDIDVNIKNKVGGSPLKLAVEKENKDIVQLLLDKGADVNIKDRYDNSPLELAVEKENKDIVQLLLDKGADVNIKDSINQTPIYIAVEKENKDIVQLLLDKGANVNITSYLIPSPLHLAVRKGNLDIIKALLDVPNIDINIQYEFLETPLHDAVSLNNQSIIEILLAKGADVNAQYNGNTPLHRAILAKNPIIVKLLLDYKAKQDIPNAKGETPLDLAQTTDDIEIKKLFGLIAS